MGESEGVSVRECVVSTKDNLSQIKFSRRQEAALTKRCLGSLSTVEDIPGKRRTR